jgi:hypothetical protein
LNKGESAPAPASPGRWETQLEASTDAQLRPETVAEDLPGYATGSDPRLASAYPPARRMTVYDPNPSASARAEGAPAAARHGQSSPAARKIVGVLVTYSWSDQGQIFPVLEGRNRIGSDPKECDIAIPQDETLSAINSHIVFRKNFTIGDDVSMGGTDVDGAPVETAFVPLRNYARIRTGSTHWVFIAVQPPVANTGDQRDEPERREGWHGSDPEFRTL